MVPDSETDHGACHFTRPVNRRYILKEVRKKRRNGRVCEGCHSDVVVYETRSDCHSVLQADVIVGVRVCVRACVYAYVCVPCLTGLWTV